MGMSVGSEDDDEMIGTINTTPRRCHVSFTYYFSYYYSGSYTYSSGETTRRKKYSVRDHA